MFEIAKVILITLFAVIVIYVAITIISVIRTPKIDLDKRVREIKEESEKRREEREAAKNNKET